MTRYIKNPKSGVVQAFDDDAATKQLGKRPDLYEVESPDSPVPLNPAVAIAQANAAAAADQPPRQEDQPAEPAQTDKRPAFPKSLEALNKTELIQLAAERYNVSLDTATTKDAIVAHIEELETIGS